MMLLRTRLLKITLYFLTFFIISNLSFAEPLKPFKIKDIQFNGLQRISKGTVLTFMPIEIGDELDQTKSQQIIKNLFEQGWFDDITLAEAEQVLIITVKERPVIQSLKIEGNKLIKEEELLKSLKDMGLAPNELLNRSLLSRVEIELQNQYHSHGLYGVKVEQSIKELDNNRVDIVVNIQEGDAAKIKSINIVGNTTFEDDILLKKFELKTGDWFSYFTKSDQYSKQKLAGDLETMRSYYLDRGFMDFRIESTQVTLSPEKDAIFITIAVVEGPRYVLEAYNIVGDLKSEETTIKTLVGSYLKTQELFSKQKVIDSAKIISDHLGSKGYAFANVNPVPDINQDKRTVSITFYVDPGYITYVRRVVFVGNTKTADEVLRREMRQSEGARLSTAMIELSKTRLERLGYFKSVTVETKPVPESTDQVDIIFTVEEQSSGSISAGVGFAQKNGVIFNLGLNQKNFLGTGDRVDIALNNSRSYRVFHIEHIDPYFTNDGISRSLKISYRKINASKNNRSDYTKNSLAGGFGFGVPLSEQTSFNFGVEYHDSSIKVHNDASFQEQKFFTSEGKLINKTFNYQGFNLTLGYNYDSRNKAIFPTDGGLYSISGMVSTPGSDLEFFKTTLQARKFFALNPSNTKYKDWTVMLKGDIAYGSAYGGTQLYPFFENFYAGGLKTLRGFEDNTVGPKQVIVTGGAASLDEPLGGDLRILSGIELFFPTPFVKDKTAFRSSFFLDAGHVIDTRSTGSGFSGIPRFDNAEDFRASIGTALTWLSQLGPLSISIGVPIKKESHDESQILQFSFGANY